MREARFMGHHDCDKVVAGLINERDLSRIREAVCIVPKKNNLFSGCHQEKPLIYTMTAD